MTLDVYVCNFGGDHLAKARALMDALLALFEPHHTERHTLQRVGLRRNFLHDIHPRPGSWPLAVASVCAR